MTAVPVFEYEEKEASEKPFALMEAIIHGSRGNITVRLHDGVHYVYTAGVLTIKIDSKSFTDIFKGSLSHYDVAYVSKETYQKYLIEISVYQTERR